MKLKHMIAHSLHSRHTLLHETVLLMINFLSVATEESGFSRVKCRIEEQQDQCVCLPVYQCWIRTRERPSLTVSTVLPKCLVCLREPLCILYSYSQSNINEQAVWLSRCSAYHLTGFINPTH